MASKLIVSDENRFVNSWRRLAYRLTLPEFLKQVGELAISDNRR